MQIIRRRNTYPFTFESQRERLRDPPREPRRESREKEMRREIHGENRREMPREEIRREETTWEEIRRRENRHEGDVPLRAKSPFRSPRERRRETRNVDLDPNSILP